MHLITAVLGLLVSSNFWIGVGAGALIGGPTLIRLYQRIRAKVRP